MIDHSQPLAQALKDAGHDAVDRVAALTQTGQHDAQIVEALMVDAGRIRTTPGAHYGVINAANLRKAHAFTRAARRRAKVVLEGF